MDNLSTDFLFSLSMNPGALYYFSSLDKETQHQINEYIQNSYNIEETKAKISQSVNALSNNDTSFLFFL